MLDGRAHLTADEVAGITRRLGAAWPGDTHGFVLDEAEVNWWGLCPTCQETQSSQSTKRKHEQESRESTAEQAEATP